MPFSDGHKKTLLTISAILIGAAISLLPLGIAVTQGFLGLGLVIMLALTPFHPDVRSKYRELIFDPITFALIVMFIVWFMVTPWSNNPWESFKVIARTAIYIMGSALIWTYFTKYPYLHMKSMKTIMLVTIVMLVIACTSLLFPGDVWNIFQSLSGKTTSATRHFKAYSSALVCLAPVVLWIGYRLGGNWRASSWAMMPAMIYIMLTTESRSSIAGVIIIISVITLVLLWAQNKLPKIILISFPLAIATGMGWALTVGYKYTEIKDSYLPTSLIDPHRQVIWRFVYEKFLEAPLTGHGVNRINFVPGADVIRADVGGAVISAHPHNWILEILSETGVFGFSALAIVLTILVWRLLTRYKHGKNISALALIALVAGFFGSNLFNFSIWSSWWLLTLFTLLAVLFAGRKELHIAPRRKKILFVVTEDWAFCSHRLPTAKAAHDAGFDVAVTAREGSRRKEIEKLGYRFIPWSIRRKSLNPFYEIWAMISLIGIFGRERPTVAYNVTLKPVIYGSIAAWFADVPRTINLFAGLGVWFVSPRPALRMVRALIMPMLRFIHAKQGTWLMVQNRDDQQAFKELGIGCAGRIILIPGSGLDTDYFTPLSEPDGPLTAILLSRMLWDKGVGETVEAARILKAEGSNIRIVLVGDPDTENPNHVPAETLRQWNDEGVIEWWGKLDDVRAVWAKAHVALLPSYYREGIPRSLLEGAACARAMIGADSPGCRDLVKDGENGLLVSPRDAKAIADALLRLDKDPELRKHLGQNARRDIEKIYSAHAVGIEIKQLLKNVTDHSDAGASDLAAIKKPASG